MKRVILLAVIQAVVLFFIIGALAYAFKGDFFYNYLAVVFAPIAGVLRFASAYATEIVLPKKAAEIAEKRKKRLRIIIRGSDDVFIGFFVCSF